MLFLSVKFYTVGPWYETWVMLRNNVIPTLKKVNTSPKPSIVISLLFLQVSQRQSV